MRLHNDYLKPKNGYGYNPVYSQNRFSGNNHRKIWLLSVSGINRRISYINSFLFSWIISVSMLAMLGRNISPYLNILIASTVYGVSSLINHKFRMKELFSSPETPFKKEYNFSTFTLEWTLFNFSIAIFFTSMKVLPIPTILNYTFSFISLIAIGFMLIPYIDASRCKLENYKNMRLQNNTK